jgi:hypothetical protein
MIHAGTLIAADPLQKATYFLSRIRGPDTEGWKLRQYDWLDQVEANRNGLPADSNGWQAIERELRNSFEDYGSRERAQDELGRLRMQDGQVDEYVALFAEDGAYSHPAFIAHIEPLQCDAHSSRRCWKLTPISFPPTRPRRRRKRRMTSLAKYAAMVRSFNLLN